MGEGFNANANETSNWHAKSKSYIEEGIEEVKARAKN